MQWPRRTSGGQTVLAAKRFSLKTVSDFIIRLEDFQRIEVPRCLECGVAIVAGERGLWTVAGEPLVS